MSLSSQDANGAAPRAQPTIRSFFQPTAPKYAAPPSASRPAPPTRPATEPFRDQQQLSQAQETRLPPVPPPLPLQATAGDSNGTRSTPVPFPAPTPTHHPNITLSPILPSHIPSLKHLNARILPVRYPESFYIPLGDPLSSGAFSRVLLWTDTPTPSNPSPKPTVIGGLICRPQTTFQPRPGSAQDVIPNALYLQSLVLQEPYRGLGLAAKMLEEVCRLAGCDERFRCQTVCAHVWTANQEGLEWYAARGFRKVEHVIEGYFRQLRPADAWVVRRDIGSSDKGSSLLDAVKANYIGSGKQMSASPTPTTTGSMNISPSPTTAGPPKPPQAATASLTRPGLPSAGSSYQDKGPGHEWNDLPEDMVSTSRSNTLSVPGSGANSGASSRSSSATGRKKRDRSYPAAAFGS